MSSTRAVPACGARGPLVSEAQAKLNLLMPNALPALVSGTP
ncbi:MAG: hypothetical protein WBD07_11605 [Vicinamibacterales bacterium]